MMDEAVAKAREIGVSEKDWFVPAAISGDRM